MPDSRRRSRLAQIRIPHVFPLLLGVILFCALLTYVIPSGQYQRVGVQVGETARTVVVQGTYTPLPKSISLRGALAGRSTGGREAQPTSLVQLLTAVPRGMASAADIIFLIFIVGGAFGILQRAGTIAAVIHGLLDRFAGSGVWLTVVLMTVVAAGGSTLGMGEELIPLVPIFLMVSREVGCDRVFGVALVYLAGAVGFAAATTNPFTLQIAQGIAGVPPASGLGLRVVFFAAALLLAIVHVERYGRRIRADPSRSLVPEEIPAQARAIEREPVTTRQLGIVAATALIFAGTLYAIQAHGWWLVELSGGFLLIGLVAAAIARLRVSEATAAFVRGMEEMTVAALVVGFAKGIQVVLDDARVLDTIVFGAAQVLGSFPPLVAAEGMLVFQTVLNFFIPSGSGQAAVTMPLMAPLADVVGLTRQTAVFAFTCGDGFSNIVIPTSGVLMASLGIAKVPYDRWIRFVLPLFLQLLLLSAIFLAIAVWVEY